MLAVETTQLSKRFGDVTAVDAVDLAVPDRSVYGFLGPNGAGKTTTIRLVLGLLRPTDGSARIFGCDIRRERVAALTPVGAVIETPAHYDHLSGRDNLEITRNVRGVPKSEVDRVLDLVRLTADQKRRVGGYSLGMKQRLALARALLGSPKLLLLDEPTNGLDPDGIQEMRQFIRGLPEQTGATVLVSSHLLSEVEQTATHVGLVMKGKLILQDELANILASKGKAFDFEVDLPDRAVELLSGARLATDVRRLATGLQVRLAATDDASAAVAAINAALVGAGIKVSGIAPQAHSLEDVYMAHVGSQDTALNTALNTVQNTTAGIIAAKGDAHVSPAA